MHHPILCAGRLLEKGWSLGGVDGQLHLEQSRDIEIPLSTERNSLQFEAHIFTVKAPEDENEDKDARIFALSVKSLEMTAGCCCTPSGQSGRKH